MVDRFILTALLSTFLTCCSIFQLQSSSFTPPIQPDGVMMAVPETPDPRPQRFAVIIGLSTEDRHHGNISLAYQVLLEMGFKRNDIFILDTSGSGPYFPKTDTTSFVSVRELMRRLRRVVGAEDEVIIYVTGHGILSKNDMQDGEGRPYMPLNPSEFMDPREFLAHVEAIVPARGLLFFDQCYWGPEFRPKSCRWTTITTAATMHTTFDVTFPRLFWGTLRVNPVVSTAFEHAKVEDAVLSRNANAPEIRPRSCGEIPVESVLQY